MHKNFRRALYTALVTGGLVVVGAASAYAVGGGQPDAAQGAPETIEGAASPAAAPEGPADGAAEVAADDGAAEAAATVTPADDMAELAPADDGAGSVGHVDISGVVEEVLDGTLGEDGLVDGILEGLLPVETEVPGADPGAGEPGVEEPGAGEPGTDEPGTEPGAGEPGTDEPGTDQPGTDPGTDGPGILDPGILDPDGGDPDVVEPGVGEPGPGEPAPGRPGRDTLGTGGSRPVHETLPGADAPGITHPAGDRSAAAAGIAAADAAPGSADAADAADTDASSADVVQEPDTENAGVDLSWGDRAVVVPTAYDGTLLAGGPHEGYLIGTSNRLDGQVVPVDVPGETLAQTGPMITGQLALVSLLLGLGIVVLRMRRRRYVV
ncbi:hypothetical protein [Promicromonospora sp. NPDC059942]|uniref:hypothetical protein n=1 Tax=Promicromonospora sp. NPDC059942 TaxID=3347009 RepID=UPI003649F0A0